MRISDWSSDVCSSELLTASLSTMRPEELISKRSLKPVFEAAGGSSVQGAKRTYRVKRGDPLSHIARTHQCQTKDLQRWNKLSGNQLKLCQTREIGGATCRTRVWRYVESTVAAGT